MTIKRTLSVLGISGVTDKPVGAWTYSSEVEQEFATWACVLGAYSLDGMDDFIEDLDGPITPQARTRLMGKRLKALDAFKAGNFDLMLAHLDALQEACRLHGVLKKAQIGEKVSTAHEQRAKTKDKRDVIKIVREIAPTLSSPRTIPQWEKCGELKEYKKNNWGRDTMRNWINEALGKKKAPKERKK